MIIIHFDLDAFFASVEQAYDSSLEGRAVAVGGTGRRSVISAASYQARKKGVKSAMSTKEARRLYPELVLVEPRFEAYRLLSREIMKIAGERCVKLEPLSLDEAYMDMGDASEEQAVEVAQELRKAIRDKFSLAVSVGIANTKMIAKLASGDAKPDGLRLVKEQGALAYLERTRIDKIWGIGPATQEKLRPLGVRTMKDLREIPTEVLESLLGERQGRILKDMSWNKDGREVQTRRAAKSVSHENTLEKDVSDPAELLEHALNAAARAWSRLDEEGVRTVSVKTRSWDFKEVSRSVTFTQSTDDFAQVRSSVTKLLESIDTSEGVRLVGVSLSHLQPQRQSSLFAVEEVKLPPTPNPLGRWAFKGALVKHPLYGEGTIQGCEKGGVKVDFEEGTKILDPDTEKVVPLRLKELPRSKREA